MPTTINGLVTAISGAITGLILETLIRAFVDSGLINPFYMVVYQLLSIVAIIGLVHTTKYWGTLYLIGWWFGLYITVKSGLVGLPEAIIESIILSIVLVTRFLRRMDDTSD